MLEVGDSIRWGFFQTEEFHKNFVMQENQRIANPKKNLANIPKICVKNLHGLIGAASNAPLAALCGACAAFL